jgi:RHS repeat-associated protein
MGCPINHRPNTDGTRDYRLWPTFDANFNVTSLVTDQGKVVERYAYTPYGERIILNGSRNYADSGADPDGSAFTVDTNGSDVLYGGSGFQGLWFDAETGQWYQRRRYNHSSLGRFTQRDPLLTEYQDGMNLYLPYRGNPVRWNDASGLAICAERCCTKWSPGWVIGNFKDKKDCFVSTFMQIASTATLLKITGAAGGIGIGIGKIFGKVGPWPTFITGAAISAVSLNEVLMAYDICNDLYCTKDRAADAVWSPWLPNWCTNQIRCTCLNPDGTESGFSKNGDRRSPQ